MTDKRQASIRASLRLDEMYDLESLDRVEATFRPMFTDDLRPEARQLIGRRILWQIAGEAEGHSVYSDQLTSMPATADVCGLGWVPLCDLADIVRVGATP